MLLRNPPLRRTGGSQVANEKRIVCSGDPVAAVFADTAAVIEGGGAAASSLPTLSQLAAAFPE